MEGERPFPQSASRSAYVTENFVVVTPEARIRPGLCNQGGELCVVCRHLWKERPMKAYKLFLMGTAGAALTFTAAQAAPVFVSPVHDARSYSDLLNPVTDPEAVLLSDELARSQSPEPDLVQYHHHHHHRYYHHHHHHHHHHHYYHHHHHHFRPGFGVVIGPGYGECYIKRRVYIDEYGDRVIRRYRVCD
jgi:hypothetical protein